MVLLFLIWSYDSSTRTIKTWSPVSPAKYSLLGPLYARVSTLMQSSMTAADDVSSETTGYSNRPEADQSSFFDGFFRTGDIGKWENGLVYVVDRLKELIKYKGLQVAPAELEALLVSHPKISDAAVIGVQDDSQATEVPRAFVVSQPGVFVQAQEVIDFVQANLSNHKRLRGGVVFVDEIPKSASGKILRKELRQRVADEEIVKAKL